MPLHSLGMATYKISILPFHLPGGATQSVFFVDCHFIRHGAPLNYCYFTYFSTNLCFFKNVPTQSPTFVLGVPIVHQLLPTPKSVCYISNNTYSADWFQSVLSNFIGFFRHTHSVVFPWWCPRKNSGPSIYALTMSLKIGDIVECRNRPWKKIGDQPFVRRLCPQKSGIIPDYRVPIPSPTISLHFDYVRGKIKLTKDK